MRNLGARMSDALAAALTADLEIVLRLFCGMLAGIVVGWERTLKQSYAGIRTFGLVGLGTATAAAIFSAATEGDEASRVVQGILTGVGFLGAGVITIARTTAEIKAGENGGPEKKDREMHARGPSGLTTAAAIWVTAALGCAAGLGDFHLAIIGAGLALVLLVVDHSIERLAGRRRN
ncbi:transport ATPase [Camelimonas fluminis]|nr:transport ATPase [Camelimonas fluminis]